MDQVQLAEISSRAIPLEKDINNGKGLRDETSRQRRFCCINHERVFLLCLPLAYFSYLGKFKKEQMEISPAKNGEQVPRLRKRARD